MTVDNSNERHQRRRRTAQDLLNSDYATNLTRGVINPERRYKATESLEYFCKNYMPNEFSLEWADFHRVCAEKMEKSAIEGSNFSLCLPRGSGKSTLATACSLWSVLCGHNQFSVYVAATANASTTRLAAMKTMLRFNPLLLEDFPEMIAPICFTEGESRKASGQRFNGQTTEIQFDANKIVFATLQGATDIYPWMADFNINMGCVMDFASIEGAIRGKSHARPDGNVIRPDFVCLDDPQTRQSAASPAQCKKRLDIIQGDLQYLGSAERHCGIVVPTTIIYEDDLSHTLVNHEKCPEFKGVVYGVINHLPFENVDDKTAEELEDMWLVQYDEKRRYDLLNGTRTATDFYIANQAKMDSTTEATWPVRFNEDKGEVSAIQSAMNSYLQDQQAFFCELQNRPLPLLETSRVPLTADDLIAKGVNIPRGKALSDSDLLVAFVDISMNVLWYTVMCFNKDTYRAHVVEYGAFPEQGRPYFTLSNLKKTIPDTYPDSEYSVALTKALDELTTSLLAKPYITEGGRTVSIDLIGVDAGWGTHTQTVYDWIKRSYNRKFLMPCKGVGSTPTRRPLVDPEKKREARSNLEGQWKFAKNQLGINLMLWDVNLWKTRTDDAFRLANESKSAFSIYNAMENGRRPNHLMFCEQITAEDCVKVEAQGRSIDMWSCKPNKDNHFFDCVVGCFMLAHVKGASLQFKQMDGLKTAPKRKKRRRFKLGD